MAGPGRSMISLDIGGSAMVRAVSPPNTMTRRLKVLKDIKDLGQHVRNFLSLATSIKMSSAEETLGTN